ncbi:Single-stranded DNA-binding protein 1-A, mitochondrial [Lamellibrachia satsuma]|nr:Single-stranded DNA-binding protein 1-A, mitochondrial [Lamellibrachia satsuma]
MAWRNRLPCIWRQVVRNYAEGQAGRTVAVYTGERGVNQVTLIGRVGQDPAIRGSEEKPVTLFQLATSQSFKSPEGVYSQKTEWHRISVFRPGLRDVVASQIKKGDRVYVSGSINYSQFTDKNTSQLVHSTSIIADNVINLTKAGGSTYTPPLNDNVADYDDIIPEGKINS